MSLKLVRSFFLSCMRWSDIAVENQFPEGMIQARKPLSPCQKCEAYFCGMHVECYQIPLFLLTIFVLTKTTWMTVFRPLALWIARRGLRTRQTRKIFKTDTAPALGRSSRTWTSKDGQRQGEVRMGKSNIWTSKEGQWNGQVKVVKWKSKDDQRSTS